MPNCKSVKERHFTKAGGIDVSLGIRVISMLRPFRELIVKPYEIRHTASELSNLASRLSLMYKFSVVY